MKSESNAKKTINKNLDTFFDFCVQIKHQTGFQYVILAGLLKDTWPEPTLVLTSLPVPAADSHPLQHDAATNTIHCGDGIPYLVLTRFSTGVHLAFRPNHFLPHHVPIMNFHLANSRWAVTQWSLGSSSPDQDPYDIY